MQMCIRDSHLVYAVYTALILLTAADGWLGTALAGGMSFGLLDQCRIYGIN